MDSDCESTPSHVNAGWFLKRSSRNGTNKRRLKRNRRENRILVVTVCFMLVHFLLLSLVQTESSSSCSTTNRLLLYQVTFKTYWTKEEFPKDYPTFRPPAQWSKVAGRSHNSEFTLFRIGSFASLGLKKFLESGISDILDELAQGTAGVYDAFTSINIPAGEGQAETRFFVDNNHSMVSIVSRIIPSPDWFVGVDSVQLCSPEDDVWVQALTIEVDAIDGGIDNGYTFTSPKWPSVPQEPIFQITSYYPSHPANSFFDKSKAKHKPIASFTFQKMKEYSIPGKVLPPTGEIALNDFGAEISHLSPDEIADRELRAPKKKRSRKIRGNRTGTECIVSKWTDWSDCTSKTCETAEQYRTRSIIMHSKTGQTKCPPLIEKRVCTPERDCRPDHFSW